ncbi:hypothetical protein [Novosphingobium sp.]|uniref:hypothetical protein n=1 Tax=Novosphingobium sp. TaxID=1874826 RepID=UPI001ECF1EA5|nr:hypothetical protein [Novosphingobium sp.]MBK9011263.1 hypothetical protein [Novosphingobium sp.]
MPKEGEAVRLSGEDPLQPGIHQRRRGIVRIAELTVDLAVAAQACSRKAAVFDLAARRAQRLAQRLRLPHPIRPLDVEEQEGRGIGRGSVVGGRQRPLPRRIAAERLGIGLLHDRRAIPHLRGHAQAAPSLGITPATSAKLSPPP